MKTYNKLYLDFTSNNTDIVTAVEDDSNSRYLDVFLLNNGLAVNLTGEEVKIYAEKPDGTTIFNNGEITEPENGRCQFLLTTQLLSVPGIVKCQVSTWKDNEQILTTLPFDIVVTKSLRNDETIESSNEYGALVILFQDYYEAKAQMTEVISKLGMPDEKLQSLDIKTMFEALSYVVQYLEENSAASVVSTVNSINNKIGTSGTTGSTTLFGLLGRGIIKGIQRGTIINKSVSETTDNYLTDAKYVEITISSVNPQKSIILLQTLISKKIVGRFFNNTTLRVYTEFGTTSISNTEWTIIEFY